MASVSCSPLFLFFFQQVVTESRPDRGRAAKCKVSHVFYFFVSFQIKVAEAPLVVVLKRQRQQLALRETKNWVVQQVKRTCLKGLCNMERVNRHKLLALFNHLCIFDMRFVTFETKVPYAVSHLSDTFQPIQFWIVSGCPI